MTLPAQLQVAAAQWRVLARRFDRLSLRERALLVVGVAVLLLIAWDSVVMRTLYGRVQTTNAQLDSAARVLVESDLDRLLDLEAQLQAQQAQKQLRLEQRAASLVAPEKMNALLTDVINTSRGLRLVSMSNLPVQELKAAVAEPGSADTARLRNAADDVPQAMAYVHGIEITLAGSYADINAYIRALETQPWHFLWRRLELDASNYPEISAHIEVATLGLEKQWLAI